MALVQTAKRSPFYNGDQSGVSITTKDKREMSSHGNSSRLVVLLLLWIHP